MRTVERLMLVIAACVLLTACRLPVSQHPLTTAMPSPIDERLIGKWEVDMSPLHDPGGEKQLATYIVRRLKDDPKQLEIVGVQDGVEQTADATRLVACHFAMHDFLNVGPLNKELKSGYAICQYRLEDDDHGQLYLMDSDYVIDAIDRGLVPGEVGRDGARVTRVAMKASPEELRQFIEKHSPDCFAMKLPLAARRVK
jgi:hypothetical protein